MVPIFVTLSAHTHGDTWPGMSLGPMTINGAAPTAAAASARMQFRLATTSAMGQEFNTTGGVGIGTITIVDAVNWQFNVPAQALSLAVGVYN